MGVLRIGFTLILIVSPVAADLSVVVEEKEKADPNIFGPGGAYAQAFALFNCSMAAATLLGPVAAGALRERYGWDVMSTALGVLSISGAIPAVITYIARERFDADLTRSSSTSTDGYSGRRLKTVGFRRSKLSC